MPIACRSAQKIINCLEFYAWKEISKMKALIIHIHRLYIRDGQKYSDVMFFQFYLFFFLYPEVKIFGHEGDVLSYHLTLQCFIIKVEFTDK